MNKHVMALASALDLAFAGPVLAADPQHVNKAGTEKTDEPVRSGEVASPPSASRCPVDPLVLPLEDGPRAQSTPYLNRLRTERYQAQVKACVGVGK